VLLLGLLLAPLGGCLTVADDDGPIMSIELLWDALPERQGFLAATCETAGVASMSWTLYPLVPDPDSDPDAPDLIRGTSVADGDEPCADAIDVIDPSAGAYELELVGFDGDDEAVWAVDCTDLRVTRFDVAYECDVPADLSAELADGGGGS
jgi:hypothetical protein